MPWQINPATNPIYVANLEGDTVSVIDGGNLTAAPVETNRIYAANYLGNSVTAINADGHQPVPLTAVITGVIDSQTLPPQPGSPTFQVFQTVNATPSFTVNVSRTHSATSPYTGLTVTNPPPTQLY